jgi:CMP-N-acetylneuraminic acid synthetase
VQDIDAALQMLINHTQANNLVTASPARRSPYFNMLEKDKEHFATLVKVPEAAVQRRQDAPACFDMNASIYVWRRHALFDNQSVINDKTLLYVMPEERSVDIDSMLDWKIVRMLAKTRKDL